MSFKEKDQNKTNISEFSISLPEINSFIENIKEQSQRAKEADISRDVNFISLNNIAIENKYNNITSKNPPNPTCFGLQLDKRFLSKENLLEEKEKIFKIQQLHIKKNFWTLEEDLRLKNLVGKFGLGKWKKISKFFNTKTNVQCSARFRRLKKGIKKKPWSKLEDEMLLNYVNSYGEKWNLISKLLGNRSPKKLRERYYSIIKPVLNNLNFSLEEDWKVYKLQKKFGSKWSVISRFFKNRKKEEIRKRFLFYIKRETNKFEALEANSQLRNDKKSFHSQQSSDEDFYCFNLQKLSKSKKDNFEQLYEMNRLIEKGGISAQAGLHQQLNFQAQDEKYENNANASSSISKQQIKNCESIYSKHQSRENLHYSINCIDQKDHQQAYYHKKLSCSENIFNNINTNKKSNINTYDIIPSVTYSPLKDLARKTNNNNKIILENEEEESEDNIDYAINFNTNKSCFNNNNNDNSKWNAYLRNKKRIGYCDDFTIPINKSNSNNINNIKILPESDNLAGNSQRSFIPQSLENNYASILSYSNLNNLNSNKINFYNTYYSASRFNDLDLDLVTVNKKDSNNQKLNNATNEQIFYQQSHLFSGFKDFISETKLKNIIDINNNTPKKSPEKIVCNKANQPFIKPFKEEEFCHIKKLFKVKTLTTFEEEVLINLISFLFLRKIIKDSIIDLHGFLNIKL